MARTPQMPPPPDDAPRTWHEWYANANSYFWLPCPLCGNHFGGHEWHSIDGKPSSIPTDDPSMQTGICPDCTRAGRGIEWPPVPAE